MPTSVLYQTVHFKLANLDLEASSNLASSLQADEQLIAVIKKPCSATELAMSVVKPQFQVLIGSNFREAVICI